MKQEHGRSFIRRPWIMMLILTGFAGPVLAQPAAPPIDTGTSTVTAAFPDLRKVFSPAKEGEPGTSVNVQILVLLTVLTLIPSILIMTTSFARIMIVLALLRQALGTPQLPPGQLLLGLSLLLTLMIMSPVLQSIHDDALEPYLHNQVSQEVAFDRAASHLRDFMYRQIDQSGNHEDIYLFLEYTQNRTIAPGEAVTLAQVPTTVLMPAFILSELKTAFVIGFRIYLPFLVIDMVIAVLLVSMGMMMLPPVLISLPFKLLLFVLADGWHLVAQSLLLSFG